ncbi:hypothetical protein ACIBP6_36870 [Nonomuraea terrae]|uniref:hypothetical protein n=1 Tax=Nonomuraea terrae TaxID=2530383 RepID=UPI0037ADD275
MQAQDVHVLKSAALPTAAVGVVAVVAALLLAGGKGALGAAMGIVLVAVFFGVTLVAVGFASRVSPHVMGAVAMGTYLVKVVAVMLVLAVFRDTTLWDFRAFAWSILVGTLVWTGFEARAFLKTKMLYVDPEVTVAETRER